MRRLIVVATPEVRRRGYTVDVKASICAVAAHRRAKLPRRAASERETGAHRIARVHQVTSTRYRAARGGVGRRAGAVECGSERN